MCFPECPADHTLDCLVHFSYRVPPLCPCVFGVRLTVPPVRVLPRLVCVFNSPLSVRRGATSLLLHRKMRLRSFPHSPPFAVVVFWRVSRWRCVVGHAIGPRRTMRAWRGCGAASLCLVALDPRRQVSPVLTLSSLSPLHLLFRMASQHCLTPTHSSSRPCETTRILTSARVYLSSRASSSSFGLCNLLADNSVASPRFAAVPKRTWSQFPHAAATTLLVAVIIVAVTCRDRLLPDAFNRVHVSMCRAACPRYLLHGRQWPLRLRAALMPLTQMHRNVVEKRKEGR